MTSRVVLSVWGPAFGNDLREAVPHVRQSGFSGVQLDATSRMIDLSDLSSSARREIRHLFSTHQLQLCSIRLEYGPSGLGPEADVDQCLDRTDVILNAASELGANVVCIDLGRLPPVQKTVSPRPRITPDMAGLIIVPEISTPAPEPAVPTRVDPSLLSHWQAAMGQLGEMADRYGMMLGLSSALGSFASLSGLLKQVDCPWFGVDFDPSQLLKDSWSLDEVFDALGPLIRHVRARDAVQGEDRRTKPSAIGRGDVKWRQILSALDQAGYAGAITVDPSELPDPRSSAVVGLKQLQAILQS